MPDIKRRDKRQNNGTSFNKAEYGIGRPVGFNQDPRDLLLRAFYMGPLPNTYTPIYMRADELNVSNQRYELSLPSSSHFLAFVLSKKKNPTPPITAQFFIIEQNQRYFIRTTLECYTN